MPRTQHLNNINPNRIYALDAQLLYMHSTPRMTTAIIEQDNTQSKIKIPHRLMMEEQNHEQENQLIEGCNYHFGFCYVNPNGWISVRHPENSINRTQLDDEPHIRVMPLGQIAKNYQNLVGHYLTTVLQVISIEPVQNIKKGEKQLTLCTLKCYHGGYLVDLNLWNHDLPLENILGNWIVFSGFRLKKLANWKFSLVSSVYSKMAQYDGQIEGIPYFPTQRYHNLSSIYEDHSIDQLNLLLLNNNQVYSVVKARLSNMQSFTYEGCSECHKKIEPGFVCNCSQNSKMKIYTIVKILLENEDSRLEATVFDEAIQNELMGIGEPIFVKVQIKSYKKRENPEKEQIVHIITKFFA